MTMCAPATDGLRLRFSSDAAEFLEAAGDYLARDPVVSTVVATVARRVQERRADGVVPPAGDWWLVVSNRSGEVVGAGMRTAPFAPYPPFLLPMPDRASVALAHVLYERGEQVLGVNGALPAVDLFAAEMVRLVGGRVEVAHHTRLHELRQLTSPRPVPGHLVTASETDVDLVSEWFAAFMGDADEQAGRRRGASAHDVPDREEILARLRAGLVWLWVDPAGTPVHLTASNPPAVGVARIGPVYTPPGQRGRGWASNAVAEVSRRLQREGSRVCLFTDQANPTSNRIYAALGYRPVVDMADLLIVP
jgi:predicted GNAT family acetyltransferase